MHMCHIAICTLPGSAGFFHIILQRHDFFKKKKITEHKMCGLIFSETFVWNIFNSKNWVTFYEKCLLVFT